MNWVSDSPSRTDRLDFCPALGLDANERRGGTHDGVERAGGHADVGDGERGDAPRFSDPYDAARSPVAAITSEAAPMSDMNHLSVIDAAFLHLGSPEMPMHVGNLALFDAPPGGAGSWFEAVKAHVAGRMHLAPVFTRKLTLMPFDFANPAG